MSRAFTSLGSTPGPGPITIDVGVSWDSKEGLRRIERLVTVGGADRFEVSTAGRPFHDLIAPAEIEREIIRDTKNLESWRQRQGQAAAASQAAAQRRAQLDAFLARFTPLARGKADAALTAEKSWNNVTRPRHEHIERRVAEGWTVTDSRAGRRFSDPTGVFFDEKTLTKLGMDYAAFLSERQ